MVLKFAGLLASEQEGIVYSAGDCMRSLVASCIDEPMIKQGVSQLQSQRTQRKGALTAIERICVTCESTLSYQYSTAWDMALHIITALFDKLGWCNSLPTCTSLLWSTSSFALRFYAVFRVTADWEGEEIQNMLGSYLKMSPNFFVDELERLW